MEHQKSTWIMGALQLAFVVGVIALALLFSAALKPETNRQSGDTKSTSSEVGLNVSVIKPRPREFVPEIRLNGVITARTQTNVAPQVGGQVVQVSPDFKQGSTVKMGDVLFSIDPSDYRLAVEQAEANILAARSDLKVLEAEAKLALREWDELFKGKEISDLAARKPQIEAARARLDGAKAAKQTAALALRRTKVRALDNVRVLSTGLNVGQIVGPNQIVGQVFSINNIEISAPLSTDELRTLMPALNRDVDIRVGGDVQNTQSGTVVRVDAVLDQRTRLTTLFISPDTPEDLNVGGFVDVIIKGDAVTDALVLPQSSLTGRDKVWVLKNEALQSRNITRLGTTDGTVIVAEFDMAEGVLVLPPVEVFEGQKATRRQSSQSPAN